MKARDLANNPNYGQTSASVAKGLAVLKGKIVKGKATDSERNFWESIPAVSVNAQDGDVVKDYSISPSGQAGVVVDVRDMRKRNGKTVLVVRFFFFGHTNLDDLRIREIQLNK